MRIRTQPIETVMGWREPAVRNFQGPTAEAADASRCSQTALRRTGRTDGCGCLGRLRRLPTYEGPRVFHTGRGAAMRLRDGRYECAQCGAVLDVPLDDTPNVMIHAASGQPTMRVISVGYTELHRCEITESAQVLGR
jgi:hypothetical protein